MPIPGVTIDSSLLTPAPARFRANPPQAKIRQAIDGAFSVTPLELGWTFDLIYGPGQLAHPEAIEALLTARDGDQYHTLSWTGTDEVTRTCDVIWPDTIPHLIRMGGLAESFTVRLLQRGAIEETEGS